MINTKHYLAARESNGGGFEGLDRRYDMIYGNKCYFVRNIHTQRGYHVYSSDQIQRLLESDRISNDEVVQIARIL